MARPNSILSCYTYGYPAISQCCRLTAPPIQPFGSLPRENRASTDKRGCLTADVDLTGREVSPTSTDYKDATFGWMDDDVRKGYQAAILSLACERWQRLLLALQRYTGRTHSAECLQAMLRELEQVLGMRPRRRVALVQAQRRALQTRIQQAQDHLERNQRKEKALRTLIVQSRSEAKTLQAEVVRLAKAKALLKLKAE